MPAVYRQSAIDRLATPEELDNLIQVTSRKSWIALIGLAMVVIVAIIWGFLGAIPSVMQARGVLIKPDGILDIKSAEAGSLLNLSVVPGQSVKQGQVIGQVRTSGATPVDLISPATGTVLDLNLEKGQKVDTTTSVGRIEASDQPLRGLIYISLAEGKRLKPGTKVQIAPSNVQTAKSGYLLGTISSISQFPATSASIISSVKSQELAQAIESVGPSLKLEVTLDTDQSTVSGYRWTTSEGPKIKLNSGTLFNATLIMDEQQPINLVLPIFSK
ncbi:MAG TPA: NHLP bacteriocin system secretion protein [Chloroflexia bacterium]|nr:NHLP bacteriocin system secretion protein [Chloroflexia bacterium]